MVSIGLVHITLQFMLLIGIIMAPLLIRADAGSFNIRSYPWLLTSLGLLVINWALYLWGFYERLPAPVGGAVFLPIWHLVCIFGLTAAFKEYQRNRPLAVLVGGLAIITSLFGVVLIVIDHIG